MTAPYVVIIVLQVALIIELTRTLRRKGERANDA